jgi:RNA polymerase sigma-70 factor (ECF subfamily)
MARRRATREGLLKEAMQHEDVLVAYAYGLLRDWAEAQDVVQDAFVVVAEKWGTFKAGASVLAWVKGIVRFKAFDAMRARGREKVFAPETLEGLVDGQWQEHMTEELSGRMAAMKATLTECLGKISSSARDLILRYYRDRVPATVLAREGNRTLNALRVQVFRIRRTLRECAERALRSTGY